MASKRISELAAISALDDDDVLAIVEDGVNKKVTVAELRAALHPAWGDWTPTLLSGGVAATYGSGATRVGRYTQINDTVMGWGSITFGTGMSLTASGGLRFILPVAPRDNTVAIGAARLRRNTGPAKYNVTCMSDTAVGGIFFSVGEASAQDVAFDQPFAWAASDNLYVQFTYEAA